MKNPFNANWQDWSKPMPHNGFTSFSRLLNAAEKLGYRLDNKFIGYPHEDSKPKALDGKLTIGFGNQYRVYYEYNSETNTYLRWRGGEKEIDKNNGEQVEASVIIFQNGEEIKGYWKKEGKYSKSKLYFLDDKGKEIKFTSGKIWVEIVEPYQEVKWEINQ